MSEIVSLRRTHRDVSFVFVRGCIDGGGGVYLHRISIFVRMSVPPPEDTVSLARLEFGGDVRVRTILYLGGVFFSRERNPAVRNTPLRFRCGGTNVLVDLWSAPLSVPDFILRAYDTSATILCLEDSDVTTFPAKMKRLVKIACAVVDVNVALQNSLLKRFALENNLPLFQGNAALYWCVHYLICK